MREVNVGRVVEAVRELCIRANYDIGEDVLEALRTARAKETSRLGREILAQIVENDRIARDEGIPMCQDTGYAVVFLELGQDVRITGGNLYDAVNEGVRRGYRDGYLRASVVNCPLERINTGDNTPAAIHVDVVPGETLKITLMPKGAGSENMSAVRMLSPADGVEGVKQFVIETMERAGANACPPVIIGVGIGATFDGVALLARKALLRPIGSRNENELYARLEEELLEEVNRLGIGPQGLGGTVTALAVHVMAAPCHIASLPCAVNFNCHAARHRTVVI